MNPIKTKNLRAAVDTSVWYPIQIRLTHDCKYFTDRTKVFHDRFLLIPTFSQSLFNLEQLVLCSSHEAIILYAIGS